jgi:glutaminyl-peptide cyclotransferase
MQKHPFHRQLLFLLIFALSTCGKGTAIPRTTPYILRTIPHDTAAFTQGLFYCKGFLYESTGLYGQSSLRVVDPKTGNILRNIPVPDIFAEGCAKMDSSLVQLSWREGGAPIYSFPALSLRGSFSYTGEGWGLTSDSASFYMSNGSDTLYIRDKHFVVKKKVAVTLGGATLASLNELEYVKGLIYANVWFNNNIYVIRPSSGAVVRIVDCAALISQNASPSNQDVLNGIAYNNDTGTFYVTGKRWRYIFEVRM